MSGKPTITGSYGEQRFVAMCSLLPDDPTQAASLAITFAATICITTGIHDDKAVSAFAGAIAKLRAEGVESGVQ